MQTHPALLIQGLILRSEPAAPTSSSTHRPAVPAYLSAGKVPYGPLHIGWQRPASAGCALLCLHFLGRDVLMVKMGSVNLTLDNYYSCPLLTCLRSSSFTLVVQRDYRRLTICPTVGTFRKFLCFPIAASKPRLW